MEEHTKNRANQSKESKEAMMFLKQKMDAAQGFIDAVRQRQNTLMVTMQAIIDLQRPFFLEGDESLLKPMILKDVAERTGLDISTISRVSNSKYVQTNYGIWLLSCGQWDNLSPLIYPPIHHRSGVSSCPRLQYTLSGYFDNLTCE